MKLFPYIPNKVVHNRWFAYLLVPGGILLIALTYAFRGVLKRLHKNKQESDGRLRVFLQERISSLMVIKAFTAEEQTSADAAAAMDPKYGMREFADHGILFDASRADDVKAIMEDLGFDAAHFGASNHDSYYKKPCLNFEMHRALFGPGHEEKLYEFYQNVEDRLNGEGCEKRFSPEDFYLYFLAHEYKHYSASGTGLRSLLDTYVYLSKVALDMNYVTSETEKLGIRDFEERNRSLSLHLFGGEELTAPDQEVLDYILSSGTYGTISHRVQNQMRKNGWGKLRYMIDRFLVPVSRKNKNYAAMAGYYPFFYQHKILLPLLPFYRMFRAMRTGKLWTEAKAVRNA